MSAYLFTRRAERDIQTIWSHIAEDSEQHADYFIDRLIHTVRLLGENPYIGRHRDELRKGVRSFPVGDYLVLYRVAKPGVRILHIVHGRRNLAALMTD